MGDIETNTVIVGIGSLIVRLLFGLCGMIAMVLGVLLFRWKAEGQAEVRGRAGVGEGVHSFWAKFSAPGLVFAVCGAAVLIYALQDKTELKIQTTRPDSKDSKEIIYKFSPRDETEVVALMRLLGQIQVNEKVAPALKDEATVFERRFREGTLKLKVFEKEPAKEAQK